MFPRSWRSSLLRASPQIGGWLACVFGSPRRRKARRSSLPRASPQIRGWFAVSLLSPETQSLGVALCPELRRKLEVGLLSPCSPRRRKAWRSSLPRTSPQIEGWLGVSLLSPETQSLAKLFAPSFAANWRLACLLSLVAGDTKPPLRDEIKPR